jgi:hypothetical protein
MPAPITIAPIARTSPTLWSHMRLCGLRAALAATPAADGWVPHDPRAWLGIAFHRLMEAMRRGAAPGEAEAIWSASIAESVAAAANHPLNRRFAAPERWPSYSLVRQRALAMAAKLGDPRKPKETEARAVQKSQELSHGPERRYEARGGRLVGKPDYYDGHVLTEYKSSLPDAAWPGAAEITDSFRRQLRLYAVIIADALGTWPAGGRIVAASGQTLEVKIDPAASNAEADAALAALDALNEALNAGRAPDELAAPSVSACSGCPFQIICPVFWRGLADGRLREFAADALEGTLDRVEPGPDDDLYTVYVAAQAVPPTLNREQAVVLRKSVHGGLAQPSKGTVCRLVGGKVRPDGRLAADFTTVMFALPSLPRLENRQHQA